MSPKVTKYHFTACAVDQPCQWESGNFDPTAQKLQKSFEAQIRETHTGSPHMPSFAKIG